VKIRAVRPNNHRRAFEVTTEDERELPFPYARLRLRPSPKNRIREAYVDPELGCEGFTYVLQDGSEDSLHLDAILDYNRDPHYMRDLHLHRLSVMAKERVAASSLSKREIIRRLGTFASQFYRLLDPPHYGKSIDQMIRLLYALDCSVEIVVREGRQGALGKPSGSL
jgi:hypothetical protein